MSEVANSNGGDGQEGIDPNTIFGHQNNLIEMMLKIGCELTGDFAGRRWRVLHLKSKIGLLLPDTASFMVPDPSFRIFGTGTGSAAEVLLL